MGKKPVTRSRRIFKWVIIVLVAALVIITGGLGYFSRKVSPFLSQRLKNQVIRSSDSLYHVEFSRFSVNPFSGTIAITAFRLIPDTAVYNRLKTLNRAPENIFDLSVRQLELRHAHPLRLLLRRKVKIKDVRFEHPVIKIMHEDLFPTDTAQSVQQALASLISGPLKAIHIQRIGLDNMTVSYKNNSHPTANGFLLKQGDVVLREFYIDTATVHDSTRFFYAKDFWVHLSDLGMPTKDSLYRLKLKDIAYSSRRQSALLQGLALEPRYSEAGFDARVGRQQDRFDLTVDSVTLSGFRLLDMFRNKKPGHISAVSLNGIEADIYHNRELPPKPGIRPLPQQALRKAARSFFLRDIAAIFTIDTLTVHRTNIVYRERSPQSNRIGKVSFERLHGAFYHITDDSVSLAKNNHCTADLACWFMGKGKTRLHVDFNLTDPGNAFSYSGRMDAMKASVLNKATTYLGLLKIRSGDIHRLQFRFSANAVQATGTVTLLYDDLSIKILSLDEVSGRLKNKGLASLVANLLVLQNGNITEAGATKRADVVYQREPEKSFLNMMWKSLFAGVKQVVGMDDDASQLKKDLQQNKLIQKIKAKKEEKNRR